MRWVRQSARTGLFSESSRDRAGVTRYGVQEMWLVDLGGRRLVRYRSPQQGSYMLVDEPDLGTPIELPALSGLVVDLHRLFG
jgi:Uma2 family endonuclease